MKRRQEDRFGPHELYLGVDAGKSFHWAVGLDPDGEIRISRRVESRQEDVDALLDEAGSGALAVMDQKNSIGSLVVRRCRARGTDVGHLPGKSMEAARGMLPVTAKNDRIDAEAIAQAGMSLRRAILPIAETDGLGASLSLVSSQLAYATRRAAMARNRLHAVLLESDPAFEAAADLSAAWTLDALSLLGGAAGIAEAGRRAYGTACARHGATKAARDALWDAACASAGNGRHPDAEGMAVKELAAEIADADAERTELADELRRRLDGDEACQCLLAVPGIGPKTAAAPVTPIGISLFHSDGRLASCCGLAPRDKDSGTSTGSTTSARSGNKALKNLLIFSCSPLVGTRNRFGRHCGSCVARGMRHSKALKAVARKRLRAIYAVMRDRVPYVEPIASVEKPDTESLDGPENAEKSGTTPLTKL